MLFFWPVIFIVVALVIWGGRLADVAAHRLSRIKQILHNRCRQRYGQAAADQMFSLLPGEHEFGEPEVRPTLAQLYVALHGYFFRYCLGLAPPVKGVKLGRREALRLFVIGFLLRWGLAKIAQGKKEKV